MLICPSLKRSDNQTFNASSTNSTVTKADQKVENRVGFPGINAEPGAGHDRVLPL